MPQPLSSKEKSLFRHLVEDYESKQYKKGLKNADQILRKSPNHGDTQAMKALILNSMGQTDEAFALAKESLKNDMKSQVCWHVYGLLWRSVRNYEEAIKAYKFALRFEPESAQVLRDLALLQVQTRDYAGYVKSRNQMLQARPALRSNWTALATAHHLAGDLKSAENVLESYEKTLKTPPPKSDHEHHEAALYKNTIIAESGQHERALEHLEEIAKTNLDKLAVMELRAKYLLELDKKSDAEKAYRALINRNPEYRQYYIGLGKSLGLDPSKKQELKEMYESIASSNERIDTARRLPLDFLEGADFKTAADSYLRGKLSRGVPSTFNNIKSLYSNQEKLDVIQELVESYKEAEANGDISDNEANKRRSFKEAVLYFLAQHYNYKLSRNLALSKQYTEELINLAPKTYDYLMMRARIQKHNGDVSGAAKTMEEARELDLKDRYINTKAAKYQLRNDDNETAVKTMSKFTRNEVIGGTVGDLIDMQSIWYITEDGEAWARRGDIAMALKRFQTIYDIYETWQEDQFDFHTFSFRKGQIRAYVDMVKWEDVLRDHPFYTRVAIDASKLWIRISDNPQLAKEEWLNGVDMSDSKAVKKAKKEQERKDREEEEKREQERKAAAAKKANAASDGDTKKPDPDPRGRKLVETTDPLTQATKFVAPLLEFAADIKEAQLACFEVYIRRKKYLIALKALLALQAIDESDPAVHYAATRFRHAAASDPEEAKEAVKLAEAQLNKPFNDAAIDLAAENDKFLAAHASSLSHVYAYARLKAVLTPTAEAKDAAAQEVHKASTTATSEGPVSLDAVLEGIALLRELGQERTDVQKFAAVFKEKFPDATVIDREAGR